MLLARPSQRAVKYSPFFFSLPPTVFSSPRNFRSLPSAAAACKVARLSEAAYFYETKLRELEHKFESHAAMLREEYLAVILQIPESLEK
jgi:hypothetical protein